ncbi:MAG: aldehyde dehydrogenase family protein [Microthrixaceae bacterium]|nr:aldehyde dehydrogenase family protein [Microthrixaceae bacterium]
MAIVTATDPTAEGRRRYELASPATLEPIGSFECASDDDVAAMVERARGAQPVWEAMGPARRAGYLRKALAHLVSHQDDLVDVIVRESGKPRTEALVIDVFAAADAWPTTQSTPSAGWNPRWSGPTACCASPRRCNCTTDPWAS